MGLDAQALEQPREPPVDLTSDDENFGLTAGAAVDAARADLTGPTAAAWLTGFTLIACATVALPVGYTFARPRSAGDSIGRWRAWLERHGDWLLIAILVIIGAVFLVQGFGEFR